MEMNETYDRLKKNLKSIRDCLDADIIDVDISMVQNKALQLTQLSGLASECKATAKKLLEQARLKNLSTIQNEALPASLMSKKLDAMCADELALFEYSDRINASISHSLDTLRTIISLYKTELENMNKGNHINT